LPDGEAQYNMRVWEVQCAGDMPLEQWYWLDVRDRTWKVAAMILPNITYAIRESVKGDNP
jgi:hypothetical protein